MRSRQKSSIGRGSPRPSWAAPAAAVAVGLALFGVTGTAQAVTDSSPTDETALVAGQVDDSSQPIESDAVIESDDTLSADAAQEAAADVAPQPAAAEPVAAEPVAEEPASEASVAEEPAVDESAAEEQASEEPAAEAQVAEEQIPEDSAPQEPAADESTEEASAEKASAHDASAEKASAEKASADDASAQKASAHDASDQKASADKTTADEASGDDAGEAGDASAALAAADTAPMTLAAADEPLDESDLLHVFAVTVVPVDANGDGLEEVPQEFGWSIAVTGPASYSSDESLPGLAVLDPVPGTYTFDVQLNAAAAAQMRFTEIHCAYQENFDTINPDWIEIQYQKGGEWAVDVRPQHATACSLFYEVTGPLPDPHFHLSYVSIIQSTDANGEPVHVADPADFAAVLRGSGGAVAGAVAEGGDIQVPADVYTREVAASSSAQPGFDIDDWIVSGWNCLAAGDSGTLSTPVELTPGDEMTCGITVTDARADLHTDIDHTGDVTLDWDGATGEVGTVFDTVVTVGNLVGAFSLPAVDDLQVTVRLGDNVELVDADASPAGWSLVSVDGDLYTYAYDGSLPQRAEASLVLATRLTSAEPARAIEACAHTGFAQVRLDNDCALLHAIADGEPQPGTDPEPEPSEEPEPEPSEQPAPEQPASPEPVPSTAPEPTVDPTPAPSAEPTPIAGENKTKDKGSLAATGSDPSGGIALGLVLLLAGLVIAGVRRQRRV